MFDLLLHRPDDRSSSACSGSSSRELSALSAENWIGLIGGFLLTVYLFVALVLA